MTDVILAEKIASFIRQLYKTEAGTLALHEPVLDGKEKEYLSQCIDSTFVSYHGDFVPKFEKMIQDRTKSKYVIAVINGTAALHVSLVALGVDSSSEVLAPSLSFVATTNAIAYCGARPIFIDAERESLGMSFESLENFLSQQTTLKNGQCINKSTQKIIKACVPTHIFGHPIKNLRKIIELCDRYQIAVVEDAAEAVGSLHQGQHVGTFGKIGVLSFNGNKIVTCGGGGAVLTNDEALFKKIKHLSTTAKIPHAWEYYHDEVGYNYRLPNLNAAVACAQFERLDYFLKNKRETANQYARFFEELGLKFIRELPGNESNYWINGFLVENREQRDFMLQKLNAGGIMARPVWAPLYKLAAFKDCQKTEMINTPWLEDRVINIPSGVRRA